MASTLITLLTLSLLAFSATARPCKTLFISSYSVSLRRFPSPSGFVTVVTEIRQLRPVRFFNNDDSTPLDHHHHHHAVDVNDDGDPQRTHDLSSLRDRTKDILSVVVALLFGVGCGVLTAATMYLAWSLFSSSRHSFDDEEDDGSPKKIGYVMIPEAFKPAKEAAAVGARWSFYRAGIAEFVATFLFLYITVLTVMGVNRAPSKCASVGIQGIAWAFGGMIFALVYFTAGISGGHINPAVTFGLFLARKLSLTRAVFYMIMPRGMLEILCY